MSQQSLSQPNSVQLDQKIQSSKVQLNKIEQKLGQLEEDGNSSDQSEYRSIAPHLIKDQNDPQLLLTELNGQMNISLNLLQEQNQNHANKIKQIVELIKRLHGLIEQIYVEYSKQQVKGINHQHFQVLDHAENVTKRIADLAIKIHKQQESQNQDIHKHVKASEIMQSAGFFKKNLNKASQIIASWGKSNKVQTQLAKPMEMKRENEIQSENEMSSEQDEQNQLNNQTPFRRFAYNPQQAYQSENDKKLYEQIGGYI